MAYSEPGGELREALEGLWNDWHEATPVQLMQYNDFLAPELESALRLTFRFFIHAKLPRHLHPKTDVEMNSLIDEWVEHFSVTLRDKRPNWRDWMP